MLTPYIVTQGKTSIPVLACSKWDAICRAMGFLQHDLGGISARKAGAA